MSSIKKFNVKINGGEAQTFDVGVDATNVKFSNTAAAPFNNSNLENFTPEEINTKASNTIYGGAYIRNNSPKNVDTASAAAAKNGNKTYKNRDNQGAGAFSISYGLGSIGIGHNSIATGYDCEANGWASHAEGYETVTGDMSNYAHAEGSRSRAKNNSAHAEGDATYAGGWGAHAEGRASEAHGVVSHAEGMGNVIGNEEGIARDNSNSIHKHTTYNDVKAELNADTYRDYINGQGSHAEGRSNKIQGAFCHAEGISNTIGPTWGSTAMGMFNNVQGPCCLATGDNNVVHGGYSIIMGLNNTSYSPFSIVGGRGNNFPDGFTRSSFVIGEYCNLTKGSEEVAFAIGGGTSDTPSNLISIRYPANGNAASLTNRSNLWGANLNACFGRVNTVRYNLSNIPATSNSSYPSGNIWTYEGAKLNTDAVYYLQNDSNNQKTYLVTDSDTTKRMYSFQIRVRIKESEFTSTNASWHNYDIKTGQIVFVWNEQDQQRRCSVNSDLVIVHRLNGIIEAFFSVTDYKYYPYNDNRLIGYLKNPSWETNPHEVYFLAQYSAIE